MTLFLIILIPQRMCTNPHIWTSSPSRELGEKRKQHKSPKTAPLGSLLKALGGSLSLHAQLVHKKAEQEREIFAAGSLPDPRNCRREIILLAAFLENPRTNSGRGWTEEESNYSSRKWSNRTQAIKRHFHPQILHTFSLCLQALGQEFSTLSDNYIKSHLQPMHFLNSWERIKRKTILWHMKIIWSSNFSIQE